MGSQLIAFLPSLENGIKTYLLLLLELSEVSHLVHPIQLIFCVEIITLKLDVAAIINEGLFFLFAKSQENTNSRFLK